MTTVENIYLQGNMAPVTEEVTATDLPITGTLPPELEGRLLRNGPNPVSVPDPSTYHWFTGSGMVHGVRLRGGRAEWYRNRWVRSPDVSKELGEEAKPNPFPPDRPVFAANTNVIGLAGSTWALVEAGGIPMQLDDVLDTVGPNDFSGTLPMAFTAHPKRDPVSGELHAVAYWWGWGNQVQYIVVGTDGKVRRTVDIPLPGGPMIHDMSLTERYAVIYDQPVVFNLDLAMKGEGLPYRWDPDYGARVGLLPREGEAADVRWFDVEPCYVFHPMNAHDTADGRVVLDVIRHPRVFATNFNGPDEGAPTLDRWTIDVAGGKVLEERIDDRGQEFPRHDERLLGQKTRYGYTVSVGARWQHGSLVKHDLETGTTQEHADQREHLEGVFVPRADSKAEDDGWIMAYAYDAGTNRSDVVVIDAQDFTAPPVAVVHLPVRVPNGFHGNWVPDA